MSAADANFILPAVLAHFQLHSLISLVAALRFRLFAVYRLFSHACHSVNATVVGLERIAGVSFFNLLLLKALAYCLLSLVKQALDGLSC